MTKPHARRSDSRSYLGAGLLVVALIGLLVCFTRLFAAMVPPLAATPVRLWVVLSGSAALLLSASAVLGDRSVLWQAPLQSVAAAALLVGVTFPIAAIFQNPNWLATINVFVCAGFLVLGAATAWLMRYLQRRLR